MWSQNKWYSIGGGGDNIRNQLGKAELAAYTSSLLQGFADAGYTGLFYDIETFKVDATYQAFQDSFAIAKAIIPALVIAVSTSYSSPYKTFLTGGFVASDNLWRKIMADPNVDVISPQLYGDGIDAIITRTYQDPAKGGPPNPNPVTMSKYAGLSAKVAPSLKLSNFSRFAPQAQQVQDACDDGRLPPNFCATGYYAWAGN